MYFFILPSESFSSISSRSFEQSPFLNIGYNGLNLYIIFLHHILNIDPQPQFLLNIDNLIWRKYLILVFFRSYNNTIS